jgi:hypothetical protein
VLCRDTSFHRTTGVRVFTNSCSSLGSRDWYCSESVDPRESSAGHFGTFVREQSNYGAVFAVWRGLGEWGSAEQVGQRRSFGENIERPAFAINRFQVVNAHRGVDRLGDVLGQDGPVLGIGADPV